MDTDHRTALGELLRIKMAIWAQEIREQELVGLPRASEGWYDMNAWAQSCKTAINGDRFIEAYRLVCLH